MIYCLAAARGQPERAIWLAGAAEAFGEVYGREWHTPWHLEAERWLAPARDILGDAATAAAWAAGHALSLEQAVAEALEEDGQA